jgi:hypothetical protein
MKFSPSIFSSYEMLILLSLLSFVHKGVIIINLVKIKLILSGSVWLTVFSDADLL